MARAAPKMATVATSRQRGLAARVAAATAAAARVAAKAATASVFARHGVAAQSLYLILNGDRL